MARESPDIPHSMRRVYRRFERWWSAHAGRLPISVRLWSAAVKLAREHGVSPTAQALRLEYGKLKRLLESADPASKRLARRPGPRVEGASSQVQQAWYKSGEGPGSGAAPHTVKGIARISGTDDLTGGRSGRSA